MRSAAETMRDMIWYVSPQRERAMARIKDLEAQNDELQRVLCNRTRTMRRSIGRLVGRLHRAKREATRRRLECKALREANDELHHLRRHKLALNALGWRAVDPKEVQDA